MKTFNDSRNTPPPIPLTVEEIEQIQLVVSEPNDIPVDPQELQVVNAVSPTVDVEEIEGGHRMTVRSIDGTQTFDVMDGEQGEPGHGIPAGGNAGDLLAKKAGGNNYEAEWITPANHAEEDNTRPITAAAVYTEIGNINALLATI